MSTLQTTYIQKPGAGTDAFAIPATDGTAGQFLKTDGNGALSFATVTDTDTTGWTWDTTGTTMTGSGFSVDGIPSTATIIKFVFKNYSQSTTGGNLRIRLRTSGGTQTSTYETVDAYYGAGQSGNTRSDGWYMNMGATSGTFDGGGELVYTGSNSWWGDIVNKRTIASAAYHFRGIGIADINDTVTGISFDQTAGTMGGGTMFVHYFEP